MNFSTDATETGIFTNPLSQKQLTAKVFTPMEFFPATAAAITSTISKEQHRCFLGGICTSSNGTNGGEPRCFSYHPNGGSAKTAPDDLMIASVASSGRGFGRMINNSGDFLLGSRDGGGDGSGDCDRGGGLLHSQKDGKCPNSATEGSYVHSYFQELTTLQAELMDSITRGKTTQTTPCCRKRRRVTQETHSTEFFTSNTNATAREMLDGGQPPPPSTSDFCCNPGNSSQQKFHMLTQSSAPPLSASTEPESSRYKRYPVDSSIARRNGRLTQAHVYLQHKDYVKYISEVTATYGHLNSNHTVAASNRAPNATWDHRTRQQHLAVANNSRWRLQQQQQQAISSSSPQLVEDQQHQQPQPSLPFRKTSLCAGRQSTMRRMTLTSDQPEENVEMVMEQRLRATTANSKTFDFPLSRDFSCSRLRTRKALPRSTNYEVESKENDLGADSGGSGAIDNNGDAGGGIGHRISSAFSTDYFTSTEFEFFDEPFKSTWNDIKLLLLQQPELQHRARYLTEGSRGPIKNRTFDGYPTIQLQGWSGPAIVQVFVAIEPTDPHLHMFYQVCIVSTKNNRGCSELAFGFTTVVQLAFTPNSESRVMSVDSIGLVKLRNSDVERRMASLSEEQQRKLLCFPGMPPKPTSNSSSTASSANGPSSIQICDDVTCRSIKPKSSSARLVYRVLLLSDANRVKGVVQVISDPIQCTQIIGGPEICRMSIQEADVRSQPELIIIGKNFVRGTRVIFRQLATSLPTNGDPPAELKDKEKMDIIWEKDAIVDPNLFYQTHLICKVPEYSGPSLPLTTPLRIQLCIQTPNKASRPETFTYLPSLITTALQLHRPPVITRLSHREAPACGSLSLVILGSNFSPDCRVFFRQTIVAAGSSASCALPGGVFEETDMIWQREAPVEADFLASSHLVCRVPPYDGQTTPLLSPLQVQIIIDSPSGTSEPQNFYYVQ